MVSRREPPRPLGAILLGGASRRYGAPKALARVGGRTLLERAREALQAAGLDPVAITAEPGLAASAGLAWRPDRIAGSGPLGGIHAALCWAEEERRGGAVVVACDMPFLAPALLRRLLDEAGRGTASAVVPRGVSRHRVEPLCAWYGVAARPLAEARLQRGERGLAEFVAALPATLLPLAEVRRFGAPEVLFLNVNSGADRARAEAVARARKESHADP